MRDGDSSAAMGIMLSEFTEASMAIVAHASGCDFVIVDAEHGPFPVEAAAALCAAGKTSEVEVLIRVPDSGRAGITKALDMGAAGVVVPMVSNAEVAHEAVHNSKYAPLGGRGVSTTRMHSQYNPGPLAAYMAEANEKVQVWLQIEDRDGLESISDIAAVAGVSGLLLGPNDLLQDLEAPGDSKNPDLHRAIRKLGDEARHANLRSGIASSSTELLDRAIEVGYDLLCVGSEVGLMISGCRAKIAEMRLR